MLSVLAPLRMIIRCSEEVLKTLTLLHQGVEQNFILLIAETFCQWVTNLEENEGHRNPLHNNIQHHDIHYKDTQLNDIQHNDIQHNDTQHKGLISDTQHK
jgi:hypothetical protein